MFDLDNLIDTPLCLDCFDLLARLPSGCVNLVFADPPYNTGVFKKVSAGEYLAWCKKWIAECSRVLAANGALWIVHSKPDVLIDLSRIVEGFGRGRRTWVTWDKYNGNKMIQACGGPMIGITQVESLRSFQSMAEYLIYHADKGNWTRQCDEGRGFIFEPLRAYLDGERKRARLTTKQVNLAFSEYTQKVGCRDRSVCEHYWALSQWCLPTEEIYNNVLRPLFNRNNGDEYLRREYEDLRQEYEHLRYTFNNPGKVSSVWQIPPAPRNGHPTPKPETLLERIILATSNEGDLILDPFGGSFTTAVVAARLGRRWISCDIAPEYVELGKERLTRARQLSLL